MASRIQIRRDTEANWTSANPTLAQGEMGIETDTLKIKIGDGTTVWTSLAYYTTAGGVSLLLDQDPAQTFTNGTVTGTGLLKVTSGEVGLDTTNYFDIATDDTDDITEGANKFVTATDITNLGNLSGTNTGDNTVCTSGAATTAVTLLTPRAIAGVSFDGTANISLNNNAITNGAGYITSYVDTTYTAGDDLLLTGTVFSNTAPNIVQTTVTGNAGSATALETPRAINGVDFDGSAPITVTADANTLSGTELASSVVTSSLTSVGTITTGVWNAGAVTSSGGISGTTGTFSEINVNGPLTAIESTMPIIKAPSTGKTVAIESIKVREGESGAFVDLVTGNKGWHGMTAIGNDVYACVYNGSIWKSTDGGAFVDLVAGNTGWVGMTSIGNDVYACVYNGSIWKSTDGGAFVDLVTGNKNWLEITAIGNDLYTCINNGSIWKSTDGGAFVDLVAGNKNWRGITAIGNDLYACVENGSIWKSTDGGAFVDLVTGNKSWRGITAIGNDVYASVNNGSIWKSTDGGAFVDLVAGTKAWRGMTSIGNDLYACVYNGSIWKSTYTADVNVAGDVSVGGDLITTTKTPASASATGTAGTIAYDADYIYVCRATDTWKRIAIATW